MKGMHNSLAPWVELSPAWTLPLAADFPCDPRRHDRLWKIRKIYEGIRTPRRVRHIRRSREGGVLHGMVGWHGPPTVSSHSALLSA